MNCDSNGIVWRGLGLDLLVRELHCNHNEALFVLSIVPITPTGVLVWGLDNVALNVGCLFPTIAGLGLVLTFQELDVLFSPMQAT